MTVLRPLVFGLLLLAACSSTPDGELSDADKLDYYFENAARYYELGEIDRCLDQVMRGLEVDDDNERLLLMKGRCHQHRGTAEDIALAESIFREHSAQDDFRVQVCLAGTLERKGVLMDVSGRQIRAGERYTEAPDPEARADELAAEARDAWVEAETHYVRAEELYSGSFEALNGQMRVARFLGKNSEALTAAEALADSIQTSNRLFRTRLQEEEARGESTVDTQRTLLDNQELEVWVRLEMAEIQHADGRNDDALENLDRALSMDPDLPDVHSRRGQLLFGMGRFDRAKASFERYLQLSEEPFDHPDIQRTYELISRCDTALAGS